MKRPPIPEWSEFFAVHGEEEWHWQASKGVWLNALLMDPIQKKQAAAVAAAAWKEKAIKATRESMKHPPKTDGRFNGLLDAEKLFDKADNWLNWGGWEIKKGFE